MILASYDEYDDVMMIRISHDENHSSGKSASSGGWIHDDAEGEIVITITTKTVTIFNIITLPLIFKDKLCQNYQNPHHSHYHNYPDQ